MAQTKSNTCPYCGKENDMAELAQHAESTAPVDGDISLCIGCGEPAIFNDDLSVRKPTAKEYADIMKEVHVQKARAIIMMCKHRNN
jgi:hypothetical protein